MSEEPPISETVLASEKLQIVPKNRVGVRENVFADQVISQLRNSLRSRGAGHRRPYLF